MESSRNRRSIPPCLACWRNSSWFLMNPTLGVTPSLSYLIAGIVGPWGLAAGALASALTCARIAQRQRPTVHRSGASPVSPRHIKRLGGLWAARPGSLELWHHSCVSAAEAAPPFYLTALRSYWPSPPRMRSVPRRRIALTRRREPRWASARPWQRRPGLESRLPPNAVAAPDRSYPEAAHRGSSSPRCARPRTPKSPPPSLNKFESASHSAASFSTTAITKLFLPCSHRRPPVTFLSAGGCSGEYNGDRG